MAQVQIHSGELHNSNTLDDTELVPKTDPRFGLISIDPERLSGAPCFAETRVPIQNLLDYIAGGETLEMFLDDFEGVQRDEATAVLRIAFEHLLEGLPKA